MNVGPRAGSGGETRCGATAVGMGGRVMSCTRFAGPVRCRGRPAYSHPYARSPMLESSAPGPAQVQFRHLSGACPRHGDALHCRAAIRDQSATAGFDLLTYYKGAWARSPITAFSTVDFTAPDGSTHRYQLAERLIVLPVPGQRATPGRQASPASTLTLRLVVRASPDGHQTPILTNRTDLSAAEIAYRMSNRWRQESGSPGALLRRGPLRTVRAAFTAHGSSKPRRLTGCLLY